MSLADLHDQLQALAAAGQPVPVGATAIAAAGLTPRAGLDDLLRSRLLLTADLPVTVTGTIAPPANGTLALTGTATALGATNATANVTFIQDPGSGAVDVRVGIEPAGNWYLGSAFPILGGEPFKQLALESAAYVVTSVPQGDTYEWDGAERALTVGADLFALLTMDGPLGAVVDLLENATTTDQVVLSGTVEPSADPPGKAGPVPALALSAPIGNGVGVPGLELSAPRVELESLLDDAGARSAWLLFATTFMANNQPLFDLKAGLTGNGGSLTLSLVPLKGHQAITPDQIASVLGGYDYRTLVPQDSELQKIFDGAGLRGLGIVVDLEGPSLQAVVAEIGSNGPWGPWGPPAVAATIDDLALSMTVVTPLSPPTRDLLFGFHAAASILPHIFTGDFEVDMAYDLDSKDVSVAASFPGTLNINELIGGISGGAVDIPADWVTMSFSDFGITFDKPGDSTAQYTLYGRADATFRLPFLGVTVETDLQAYVESATPLYKVLGTIMLAAGDRQFAFAGDAEIVKGDTTLKAGWSAPTPADRLGIGSVATAIGLPAPSIPDGLDLDLQSAGMTYAVTKKVLVLDVDSASYGKGLFASYAKSVGNQTTTQYFAGIKVDREIDLVNLPLLKTVLGGSGKLAVDGIQVLVSSPLAAADVTVLDAYIDAAYPRPPTDGMDGLALAMTLDLGAYKVPLNLTLGAGGSTTNATTPAGGGAPPPAGSTPPPPAAPPPAPTDGTVWLNLQKTVGPLSFQKVGIRYSDSVLWFLMNASLSAGGMTISVFGLGAGSPLKSFDPKFTINGLGLTIAEGPVEISAALLGTLDPVNFYGELLVSVEAFRLGALGGYAEVDGHPSFFGYVVLDAPLGGPPFFFITGLAGGIGFNRQLVIPHVDGVANFPLVSWATGSGNPPSSVPGSDPSAQVTQVVQRLADIVPPAVGEYWLAAGLHFTVFKALDCFALVVAKVGTEFEVALLGLATAQIPPDPSPAVAKVQLALEASYAPSTGLIAIGGQLTPASYVLAPECHLTGGFAFWTWVSGPHEGEFLVTLGGYSPRFTPPDYYPQVPRLGLSWNMDPLTIQGGLYFALTASAVMAGGSLSATWKSGDIRAWFTVEADFLIVFEPFHYYISAGIQLGASFSINLLFTRVTVSIHLGVDIEIWGPEFTGKATVDLSIVSFTIHFGSTQQSKDKTIPWPDFVSRLLPHAQPPPAPAARNGRGVLAGAAPAPAPAPAIVQIQVAGGMLKQLDGTAGIDFIADGERLSLITRSAIPAKTFTGSSNLAITPPDGDWTVGIGPTGTAPDTFSPNHDVQITTANSDRRFVAAPATNNVATALWQHRTLDDHGVPQGVDPVNDTTIPDVATGLKIDPHAPDPKYTLPIPLEQLLYTEDETIERFDWSASSGPTTDPFSNETVWGTITAPLAETNRGLLVAEIAAEGLAVPAPSAIDVSELATQAAFDLLEPPALRLLGEQR